MFTSAQIHAAPPPPKVEEKVGYRFAVPNDPLMAQVRKLITYNRAYSNISSKERVVIAASSDEYLFQGTDEEVLATLRVSYIPLLQPQSKPSPSKQATID